MYACLSGHTESTPRLSLWHSHFYTQALAVGLGALYSGLPTSLSFGPQEEWSSLDCLWKRVPRLDTFLLSLQFCNDVVQV